MPLITKSFLRRRILKIAEARSKRQILFMALLVEWSLNKSWDIKNDLKKHNINEEEIPSMVDDLVEEGLINRTVSYTEIHCDYCLSDPVMSKNSHMTTDVIIKASWIEYPLDIINNITRCPQNFLEADVLTDKGRKLYVRGRLHRMLDK